MNLECTKFLFSSFLLLLVNLECSNFFPWLNTNTINIHNHSLLLIKIWILFINLFDSNTNMNIIHWEYSRIYLKIQIFATLWIGSPKVRAYSTVPFVDSVIYHDYRVTTEHKMGGKNSIIQPFLAHRAKKAWP